MYFSKLIPVSNNYQLLTRMKACVTILFSVLILNILHSQNGSFHERRISVSTYVAQHLDSINPKKDVLGVLLKLNYNSEEVLQSIQYYTVKNKQELLVGTTDLTSLKQVMVWPKLDEYIWKVYEIDVSPFDDEYTAERTYFLPFQTGEILAQQKSWNQEEKEKWRKMARSEITYIAKVNNLIVGTDSVSNIQLKTKLYGYSSEQITLGNNFVMFFRLLETSEDGQRIFFLDMKIFHKDVDELKQVFELNRQRIEGTTIAIKVSPFMQNGSMLKNSSLDMKLDFTKRLYE